jgi:hypothetical protein
MQQDIDVFREEYQVPVALSFMAVSFSVVSGAIVLWSSGPWHLYFVSTVAGLVLGITAYLLALERAEEYGEQVRAIVDLQRQRLVGVWEGPAVEEAAFFERAQRFVELGEYLPTTTPFEVEELLGSAGEEGQGRDPPTGTRKFLLEHFRLLYLVIAVGGIAVACGSWWLANERISVLVASEAVEPFERISVTARLMSPREVPPDTVQDRALLEGMSVVVPVQAGAIITESDLIEYDTDLDRTILDLPAYPAGPIGEDVKPGDVVAVQLRPCGDRLDDVRVLSVRNAERDEDSSTISISISQTQLDIFEG